MGTRGQGECGGGDAEPPRPRAAVAPAAWPPTTIPQPQPQPGCALPLAAVCISVTPAAEGCGGGEGRPGRRGPAAPGMPQWLPAAVGQSPPGPGSSRQRRRSRLGRWQPLRARPNPSSRGYLILDVLLPPLGSDVRGEVLGELHPAVSPSLPPGSSSYRRRRRQQRLRLLPTWAPALREAALLSSSAAAEVSSEPPSRHLPPPLHSPAPPRPLDVIAMVTAYAAPTEGAEYGAWPRGLSLMLRPFGPYCEGTSPDLFRLPPVCLQLLSTLCLGNSTIVTAINLGTGATIIHTRQTQVCRELCKHCFHFNIDSS